MEQINEHLDCLEKLMENICELKCNVPVTINNYMHDELTCVNTTEIEFTRSKTSKSNDLLH